MDNKRLKEVKEIFRELEAVVNDAKDRAEPFKDNARFQKALSAARQGMEEVRKEKRFDSSGPYDPCDTILDIVEALEDTEQKYTQAKSPECKELLRKALADVKDMLAKVNAQWAREGK